MMGIFHNLSKVINKDYSYEIEKDENGKLIVRPPDGRFLLAVTGPAFIKNTNTCILKEISEEIKNIGKKEGYEKASVEYEKKLLKQADEFSKKQKKYKSDKIRYQNLLDGYELRIDEILKNKKSSNSYDALKNSSAHSAGSLLLDRFNRIQFNKPSPLIEEIREVGKKEGYEKASIEYENKLLKQAEEFLKKEKTSQDERIEFEKLIDAYKKYIQKLH